jgi:UDP-2-acetamido-2-deoxy-ribo-hexuluronate aminotransferase
MEKIQMVDLKGQYLKIKDEIDSALAGVIDSTSFINGPAVADLERNLKSFLDVDHVIACGNGTDALQIALMAFGLEPGDEIITTPFTFVATVEAIALLGLKPVFADVHPEYFNIDAAAIEKAITPKTRVILPVHLYGQCADMDAITGIARRHNLVVIEDAAQALGSEYTFIDGRVMKAGTMGHAGCTSFFPSKNLGCFGDGGAIFSGDLETAENMRCIALHGSRVKYYHDMIGINSRLDTIQAAVLNVKLRYLESWNKARAAAAGYYNEALKDIDRLELPRRMKQSTHIFHCYTLKTDPADRDGLRDFLQARQIPTMLYYPVPMHLQKAYTHYGYREGDFPVSEKLCRSVLSLPMHTELQENQLDYICSTIREYYNR